MLLSQRVNLFLRHHLNLLQCLHAFIRISSTRPTAPDLGNALGLYLARSPIGRSYMHMLIDFTEQVGNMRRPEVSFVSERRWPRRKRVASTDGWQVVPELAIEFVSPDNTANEVIDKIAEYSQAGVDEVWIVWPKQSLIYRYSSPTDVRIFKCGDVLTTDLLPGFQLPRSKLFESDEDLVITN